MAYLIFWLLWPVFGQGASAGVGSWDNMTNRARTTENYDCWNLESGGRSKDGLPIRSLHGLLTSEFCGWWKCLPNGIESFLNFISFYCILLLSLRTPFVS